MPRIASAVLIAFVPVTLMIFTSQAGNSGTLMLVVAAATVVVSLLVYQLLGWGRHPGLYMLLAVYLPAAFWVFLVIHHPIFLPLFYAGAGLVVLTSCLGAALAEDWSWFRVGSNGAFFSGMLLAASITALIRGQVWGEASLMTVGAFSIAWLCNVDVLGWLRIIPRVVKYLMEKIWY